MLNPSVDTLMITSRCSAGCLPCPFATANLPQRFLAADEVVRRLVASQAELVVVTGGEPLEHPHFETILDLLRNKTPTTQSAPFRIATGGHIPLARSIAALQGVREFVGFSLGTDVISEACPEREKHTVTWKQNLRALNCAGMPYSLTFTLHGSAPIENISQMQKALLPLIKASLFGAKPEFIYIRHADSQLNRTWLATELAKTFQDTVILYDLL